MNESILLQVGARASALSQIQTKQALAFISEQCPSFQAHIQLFQTPGDRDLTTPIEQSASDFFTRDLDEALRTGTIDCAIHSAKDLPSPMPEDLDWFYLPLREDPRDCWVTRSRDLSRNRIGVSSSRRADYARRIYPHAEHVPIRGAIDARIEQIREGKYDAVLMALAGLNRLYPHFPEDLTCEPIPCSELTPPETQGILAVVFKKGHPRLTALRTHFVKAVRFVSAGVGEASLCTLQGARDLEEADVVLYDELLGADILTLTSNPSHPRRLIPVGKRCGAHSKSQAEITRLLCDEVRTGARVVRLKGGDAGLFGRLAEETDALIDLHIPFVVRPGVSALTAATTSTGMLLTRRGVCRGFCAYTPRSTGNEMPRVVFMASQHTQQEASRLLAEGLPPSTPCALVWNAASPAQTIWQGTLQDALNGEASRQTSDPGLFLVGSPAAHLWPRLGRLQGARILLTTSPILMDDARCAFEDAGAHPLAWSLLKPTALTTTFTWQKDRFTDIVLTSPNAVEIFLAQPHLDVRTLPRLWTCGPGCDRTLRAHGLSSDVMPAHDFSAHGLIGEINARALEGHCFLRVRSRRASQEISKALRARGANVEEAVLYDMTPTIPSSPLPSFDGVFFASSSAVEIFKNTYGYECLTGKSVYVIGEPTQKALPPSIKSERFPVTPAR